MAFKRKRVSAPRRPFFGKRRRVFRRKRFGRSVQFTSQSARGSSALAITNRRRWSGRRFRRVIMKSTDQMVHYRCLRNTSNAQTTNALGLSNLASDVYVNFPFEYLGVDFFTAAGGAIPVDGAIAVPTFNPSSIVIRGGTIYISISNMDATSGSGAGFAAESLRVKFWYGFTNSRPANIPALFPSQQNQMWDPTCLVDFRENYGKIYYAGEVLLQGGQVFEFKRRLRPQKVDYAAFKQGGNQPFFMYQVCTIDHSAANNSPFTVKAGINISFSGDAV